MTSTNIDEILFDAERISRSLIFPRNFSLLFLDSSGFVLSNILRISLKGDRLIDFLLGVGHKIGDQITITYAFKSIQARDRFCKRVVDLKNRTVLFYINKFTNVVKLLSFNPSAFVVFCNNLSNVIDSTVREGA